ncbi:hypothetical protein CBM2591_B30011 [Cupriavidus taiwanensis]|nr:hypothetical protein CBM2591_B30011 [Cupriavidus taiwanensis]SOZ91881.1 hypothetical protein CBM2622_B60105 [Cupriavidus taiwanensis]SPD56480.1 protein of unknown function [Cupriavidus taiwanensis]
MPVTARGIFNELWPPNSRLRTPSPACGRGLGRGREYPRSKGCRYFTRLPSPPAPLPQAGEGSTQLAFLTGSQEIETGDNPCC